MTSLAPSPLKRLANRKAALTRHYGATDERTIAVASELKLALLAQKIREAQPLTEAERTELIELLLAA